MHAVLLRLHLGGLICCFLSVFCSEAFERGFVYCISSGHERISSLLLIALSDGSSGGRHTS
jgi:hypothetical protein